MNIGNASLLAACALAGSAVAAVSLHTPPVENSDAADPAKPIATGAADTNEVALAADIRGISTVPDRTAANSIPSGHSFQPRINDPAFLATIQRERPQVPPVDPANVPAGVDTGANDPDFAGAMPRLAGEPLDCTCIEEYFPGDLVVAAVNFPQGNTQIPFGAVGTVVCGRFFGGGEADLVLVEWDITNGHDGSDACDCPIDGVATDPQGWYVACSEIVPFTLCVCAEELRPGDTVYSTVEAPDGNGQIRRGDSGTVVCGRFFGGGESDLVLVEWDITNGHAGAGLCDCPEGESTPFGAGWYVLCSQITKTPPTDCVCPDDVFFPGETMYATVDNPDGNAQILAGDAATVICGDVASTTPAPAILGQWNINSGHQNVGSCDCPLSPPAPPVGTGWYVSCNDLHPLNPPILCSACAGEFGIGDVVWARTDNPSDQQDIQRGWRGVVVCGNDGGLPLLVQWDDLTSGHTGGNACDCPNGASTPAGTGWYVECNEVSRAPIPCPGDSNFDNTIDVLDLLDVLGDWGPCAGCLSDMNGDDVVDVLDLLAVLGKWGSCP